MDEYIKNLREVMKQDPYSVLTFIGFILLATSITQNGYKFEQIAIFFIYSVLGLFWRYAEKDLRSARLRWDLAKRKIEKPDPQNIEKDFLSRRNYHFVNLVLLALFLLIEVYASRH